MWMNPKGLTTVQQLGLLAIILFIIIMLIPTLLLIAGISL